MRRLELVLLHENPSSAIWRFWKSCLRLEGVILGERTKGIINWVELLLHHTAYTLYKRVL